jgi:hypothetical protein
MDRRTFIKTVLKKHIDAREEGRQGRHSNVEKEIQTHIYNPPVYSRYTPKTRRKAFGNLVNMIHVFSTSHCPLDTFPYKNK